MGLHQRRRPEPIKIYPHPARRQEDVGSESPDSPDSPGTSLGPDSPGSPTTTAPAATTAPAPASSTSAASSLSVTSQDSAASAASSTATPLQAVEQTTSSATSSATPSATSLATATVTDATSSSTSPTNSSSNAPSITARPVAPPVADIGDDQNEPESPTSPTSSSSQSPSSSPTPTDSSTSESEPTSSFAPTTTDIGPPPSRLAGASAGIDKDPPRTPGHKVLGKGAEAALITSAVFGFVALLVGAYFLYKRRKRRTQQLGRQHAESGFGPDNSGSVSPPETVHIRFDPGEGHVTRSTNNSDSLFGGSHYQRPETVSTNSNPESRIQAGLPTPNPFADDPSRNKAFDQLRGRPRSTTLTDRGSWIQNPFRDPESDRFDPFGELQEKARAERVKYVQELKQQDLERRERDHQFLEKERMGLGLPVQARKGSGVTVDGVGVLDRSASERYR